MELPTSSTRVSINDKDGLHLRAAVKVAEAAEKFQSHIRIVSNGTVANAKSAIEVLLLVAKCGTPLLIEASGPDSLAATNALADVLGRCSASPATNDAATA